MHIDIYLKDKNKMFEKNGSMIFQKSIINAKYKKFWVSAFAV